MTCKCQDPYCETRDCKTAHPYVNRLIALLDTIQLLQSKGDLLEEMVGSDTQENLQQNLEIVQRAALQEIGQIEYDRLKGS